MKHKDWQAIRSVRELGDLVCLNIAFVLAYQVKLRTEFGWLPPMPYIALLGYLNLAWIFLAVWHKSIENEGIDYLWTSLREAANRWIGHLFLSLLLFFVLHTVYFSRIQFALTSFLFGGLLVIWRAIFARYIETQHRRGRLLRTFIVVGYDELGKSLVEYFANHPALGCRFMGFFDNSPTSAPPSSGVIKGALDDVIGFVQQHNIDEIYCTSAKLPPEYIKSLSLYADRHLIRFKILPNLQGVLRSHFQLEDYDNIPVLASRAEPLNDTLNLVIKRVFDIIFSTGVILLVMSWLVPLVAIAIKLDSRGPVFFIQRRGGRGGREFRCWKFRTMRVAAPTDGFKLATAHDDRITRVGRFLRRTSLDEFPQFLNVWWGDMTIVGPRPHAVEVDEVFQDEVEKYMVRYLVKPGITGLAQVKGFRGNDEVFMKYRVRLDVFYVENWSFLLDLKIILLTIIKIFQGDENAF